MDPLFEERFAPTMRMPTLRSLFVLANTMSWKITVADIDNAFLHGILDEPEYMKAPRGFAKYSKSFKPGMLIKLVKSIYGLKNSAAVWSRTLGSFLKDHGFVRLISDPGVFKFENDSVFCIIGSWVDDLCILCSCEKFRSKIIKLLDQRFGVKDLGEPTWCLGIRVAKTEDGRYSFNQSTLVDKLAATCGLTNASPVSLPLDPRVKLTKAGDDDVLVDSTAYRRIIGGAMYLMTGSRPDIAYAISALSRYVSKPTETHFTAALHLVRYLIGTKHYALLLGTSKPDGKLSVSCYVDASYAADLDTRRSITGFLIAVNDSTVMWKSHRQPMVTLSSAEAEYVALSVAMKEVVAMTNFLQETGAAEIKLPMRVYEDNAAVIKMSTTTWSTPRSRHIAIRHIITFESSSHLHALPSAMSRQDFSWQMG